jgi:iron complex outermembrane receptor protein
VNGGLGNYDRVDLNGALNLPLGDKAALRVAGTYSRADGWFRNVVPGMPDLAGVSEYAVRGTLNMAPADRVRLKLVASTSHQDPRNYGVYAQPEEVNRVGLDTWQIASAVPQRRRAETHSVAFDADIDVTDSLTFTSISSWDEGSLHFVEDTDGQAQKLFEIPYDAEATQFAQDLRLTSNSGGPLEFILGAYFSREKVFNSTNLRFANDVDVNDDGTIDVQDCIDGFVLACQFVNRFDQVKQSTALYTDLKYALTGRLALRGGLRYTHDTGRQYGFRSDALGVDDVLVVNLIPPSSLRYENDDVSGKVGIDYTFDSGRMMYASVSRGYRAPSFNAQAFFDPAELSVSEAEELLAYEVGAKTQAWDRRITLNLGAFYYDYRNQQLISSDPATATQTLQNIPRSRSYGGEVEMTLRGSDRMTLRAGLGLLSSEVTRGTVSGTNVAGNQLTNAPKLTFNAGLDLTVLQGGYGTVSFHPELVYQSSQFFEVFNVPRLEAGGYALYGAHLDWKSPGGRYVATAWGKNLGNKLYYTSRGDLLAGFGFDYNHIGNPRTYGVTVGARF